MGVESLDLDEKDQAQKLIDEKSPGSYVLKQIYGPRWDSVRSPTTFGKRFFASVLLGELRNIKHDKKKSNNHHLYRIK